MQIKSAIDCKNKNKAIESLYEKITEKKFYFDKNTGTCLCEFY